MNKQKSRLKPHPRPALALVLLLAACSSEPEPAPPPAPRLGAALLAEAEYALLYEEDTLVRLHEGRYVREDGAPLTVTMHPRVALGDLDEDGAADAAVVLLVDGGGSGTFYELAALVDRDGRPVHAASLTLGDRIDLERLAIEDGEIVVHYRDHGPQDPLCCPSRPVARSFALGEEGLVDVTLPDQGETAAL